MILAKMEEYSSMLFPSDFVNDSYLLCDHVNDGLYGRKRKKKLINSFDADLQTHIDMSCELNGFSSACNASFEVPKKLVKMTRGDSDLVPHDSASLLGTVDMEGFYEINVSECYLGMKESLSANDDVMLSASTQQNMNRVTPSSCELYSELQNVSACSARSSSSETGTLPSDLECDVDALLSNTWQSNESVSPIPSPDVMLDISGLGSDGYLLPDIPSHPDLACDSKEVIDSLFLPYAADKSECQTIKSSIEEAESVCVKTEPITEDLDHADTINSISNVCGGNNEVNFAQDEFEIYNQHTACLCGFSEANCICSNKCDTELSDDEENFSDDKRTPVRRIGKRKMTNRTRLGRRGPGRPRKFQNVEVVRRGPGRPRKKSTSDAVVWYQSRRKRTVSFSNGCRHRNRRLSESGERTSRNFCNGRSSARASEFSERSPVCRIRQTSVQSLETDEEDIVDVVSIGGGFHEQFGVSTMAELLQHISSMHNYHTVRMTPRRSSLHDRSSRKSASKFSINLPMSAKSSPSRWSDYITRDGRRRRLTIEQRSKREALNDLERRRRYALARELTALREVVPEINEGFRAAKVVILAAAKSHIRYLERRLHRDQNILQSERERNAKLKSKLAALSAASK